MMLLSGAALKAGFTGIHKDARVREIKQGGVPEADLQRALRGSYASPVGGKRICGSRVSLVHARLRIVDCDVR
jgi:hypothetical protein